MSDRYMLDVYESRLLRDGNEDLRLFHATKIGERAAAMLSGPALEEYNKQVTTGGRWVVQTLGMAGPNAWWSVCQLVISLAGAAIPVLSQFGV